MQSVEQDRPDELSIKSPLNQKKNAEASQSTSIYSIMDRVAGQTLSEIYNSNSNIHLRGLDTQAFIDKILNEINSLFKDSAPQTIPDEARILMSLKYSFRFYLDEKRREYLVSTNQHHPESDKLINGPDSRAIYKDNIFISLLEGMNRSLEGKLLKELESPGKNDYTDENMLYIVTDFLPRYLTILSQNPTNNGKETNQKREKTISQDEKLSGLDQYTVDPYTRSRLQAWINTKLEKHNGEELNAFPYAFFASLRSNTYFLVVVNRLDRNFISRRVEQSHRLPAVNVFFFDDRSGLFFSDNKKEYLSLFFNQILGKLHYSIRTEVTQDSLEVMSEEATTIARHWYTTGLDRVTETLTQNEMISGKAFAMKVVSDILCAKVEGNARGIETYPFDRAYVIPGASYQAAEKLDHGDFQIKVYVIETAIKSKRPQDRGEYLSAFERGKKAEIEKQFDLSDKIAIDPVELTITGKNGSATITSDFFKTGIHEAIEKSEEVTGQIRLKDIGNKISYLMEENSSDLKPVEKINKTIYTLFTRFRAEEQKEKDDERVCQNTFEFFSKEGLLFENEFNLNISDLDYLDKIQQAYFDYVMYTPKIIDSAWKSSSHWYNKWGEHPENNPLISFANDEEKTPKKPVAEFLKHIKSKEARVLVVSFDPSQHTENREGIIPPGEAFTLILVTDEDFEKSQMESKAEVNDLKHFFQMAIRQNFRNKTMVENQLQELRSIYEAMTKNISHKIKHLGGISKNNSYVKEIDELIEKTGKLYKEVRHENSENKENKENKENNGESNSSNYIIKKDVTLSGVESIYRHFFSRFIYENTNKGGEKEFEIKESLFNEAFQNFLNNKLDHLSEIPLGDLVQIEVELFKNKIEPFRMLTQEEIVSESFVTLFNNALQHAAQYKIDQTELKISANMIEKELQLENLQDQLPGNIKNHDGIFYGKAKEIFQWLYQCKSESKKDEEYKDTQEAVRKFLAPYIKKELGGSKKAKSSIIVFATLQDTDSDETALLVINIINESLPVDKEILDKINSTKPKEAGKNKDKSASTGVGIYIARVQLKQIHRSANISVKNVENNWVKTSFSIQVTKNPIVRSSMQDSVPKTRNSNIEPNQNRFDILYVEDDDKIRNLLIDRLKKADQSKFQKIIAFNNMKSSVELIERNDLQLLITDLDFYNKPGESAKGVHGYRLISYLYSVSNKPFPPVVISTGQSYEDVIESLKEHSLSGKTVNLGEEKPVSLDKNTIYIAPDKILARENYHDLDPLILDLIREEKGDLTDQKTMNQSENYQVDKNVENHSIYETVTFVNLYDEKLTEELEEYRLRHCDQFEQPEEILAVTCHADTIDELYSAVRFWLSHEGIQDINPFASRQKHSLSRNEMFRTILLNVIITEETKSSVHPFLRYWSLTRNILISSSQIDEYMAHLWAITRFGRTGVLRLIRHDIKNITSVEEGILNDFLDLLNEAERKIAPDSEVWSKLDQALLNGKEIAALLMDDQDPSVSFKDMLQGISSRYDMETVTYFHGSIDLILNTVYFLKK